MTLSNSGKSAPRAANKMAQQYEDMMGDDDLSSERHVASPSSSKAQTSLGDLHSPCYPQSAPLSPKDALISTKLLVCEACRRDCSQHPMTVKYLRPRWRRVVEQTSKCFQGEDGATVDGRDTALVVLHHMRIWSANPVRRFMYLDPAEDDSFFQVRQQRMRNLIGRIPPGEFFLPPNAPQPTTSPVKTQASKPFDDVSSGSGSGESALSSPH